MWRLEVWDEKGRGDREDGKHMYLQMDSTTSDAYITAKRFRRQFYPFGCVILLTTTCVLVVCLTITCYHDQHS